jgi:signal transduction histidine kinase
VQGNQGEVGARSSAVADDGGLGQAGILGQGPALVWGWRALPFIIGGLLLVASIVVASVLDRARDDRDRERFGREVQLTQDRIVNRVETYVNMMLSARALLSVVDPLDVDKFRRWIEHLDVQHRHPGVRAIGFALSVAPGQRGRIVEQIHGRGDTTFHVWPGAEGDPACVVTLVDPNIATYRRGIGFDMCAEPVRRAAMEQARDSGMATASDWVIPLLPPVDESAGGFLVFVPVYRGEGVPASVERRRRDLIGFVFTRFRAQELFRGILGADQHPSLSFTVGDPQGAAGGKVLFQSDAGDDDPHHVSRMAMALTVPVAGRQWQMRFRSRPSFDQTSKRLPFNILLAGLIISLAVTWVVRTQMRARATAEEAVRSRDAFVSIASHELKAPLTTLRLQSQGLLRAIDRGTAEATDSTRTAHRASIIEEQARRLSKLIDDLMDVSKISAGRLTFDVEEVDLVALVREVVQRMEDESVRAGSAVEVQLSMPVVGRWDRARLDQVLTNLLSNAIKYGARRPVSLTVESKYGVARVRVHDQGIGIAAEHQDRIFERFERLVADRHYGGFGLGLWITRHLVEAQGGRVMVQSKVGEGSTFVVELPTGL